MDISVEKIIKEIETYLAATGISATALGQKALNDPAFMTKLRRTQNVGIKRLQKLADYMESHPPVEQDKQ